MAELVGPSRELHELAYFSLLTVACSKNFFEFQGACKIFPLCDP